CLFLDTATRYRKPERCIRFGGIVLRMENRKRTAPPGIQQARNVLFSLWIVAAPARSSPVLQVVYSVLHIDRQQRGIGAKGLRHIITKVEKACAILARRRQNVLSMQDAVAKRYSHYPTHMSPLSSCIRCRLFHLYSQRQVHDIGAR